MFNREIQLLMRKEWQQLRRNRAALLSALLLPSVLLLVLPLVQIIVFSLAPPEAFPSLPSSSPLPPRLAAVGGDPRQLLRLVVLPLFVTIGGLIIPSSTAVYTLIGERESRTLELLVGLPVTIGQILWAKLLLIVIVAVGVTFTLFTIDAVVILAFGISSVGYVLLLLVLLVCTLTFSTASALLISLLARDFRAANNLTGALVVPALLASIGILLALPYENAALGTLAALYALAAAIITAIALRVITFERLLS